MLEALLSPPVGLATCLSNWLQLWLARLRNCADVTQLNSGQIGIGLLWAKMEASGLHFASGAGAAARCYAMKSMMAVLLEAHTPK